MPANATCPSPELGALPAPTSSPSPRSHGQGSTGPRTPAGKRAIANNALSHGLCSKRNVLPGEDANEFTAHRDTLWRDLAPVGAVEQMLVERIVSTAWRLRRVVRVEYELLDAADQPRRQQALLGGASSLVFDTPPPRLEHQLAFAYGRSGPSVIDRVARYEVTLERSLHRNLHELERLQARRDGLSVATPIAVDVDVDVDVEVAGGDFESQNPGPQAAPAIGGFVDFLNRMRDGT